MRKVKFDVKLPTKNLETLTQNAKFDYSRVDDELKAVFKVFDSDSDGEENVLSGDEIKNALQYFAKMESQIVRCGKRNDNVISYLDFEEIAKDEKFKDVAEHIDNNSKKYTSGESIAYVANYLASLTSPNTKIDIINTSMYFSSDIYGRCSSRYLYPEQYGNSKIINGEVITAITKGAGIYKAKNGRGNYVSDPAIVAQIHGLTEDKSIGYKLGRFLKTKNPAFYSKQLGAQKTEKVRYEWDECQLALVKQG